MTAELSGRIWGWVQRVTDAGEIFRRPRRLEGLSIFEAAWTKVN